MSVFSGGFDIEAAAGVVGGAGDEYAVVDGLARLVDKSLLIADERSGRYRMLETLRQYGHERLMESDGNAEVRGRHLDFYLERAEKADRKLAGALLPDLDNYRSALDWSIEVAPEKGLRLITILAWLYTATGMAREGRAHIERLLPRVPEAGRVRAWGLYEAGWFAWWQVDVEAALVYFDQAVALARQLGDLALLARALQGAGSTTGNLAWRSGDPLPAERLVTEALTIFREEGDIEGQASCLMALGIGAFAQGDLQPARENLAASLELRRSNPRDVEKGTSLAWLALVSLKLQKVEPARVYLTEGLGVLRQLGNRVTLGMALASLMQLAGLRGELELAVLYGAAAEFIRKQAGMERFGIILSAEDWNAPARARLGESRVAELQMRGRGMSLDEVLDDAAERLLKAPA